MGLCAGGVGWHGHRVYPYQITNVPISLAISLPAPTLRSIKEGYQLVFFNMSTLPRENEEREPLLDADDTSLQAPRRPTSLWKRAAPFWWVNRCIYSQSFQVAFL